jgi:capsular polysaccharide biosynthesis protein
VILVKFKIFVRRFLRALRKKMLLVILMILIGLAVGVACNFRVLDDEYVATSSIYTMAYSSYTDKDTEVYMFQTYKDIILSKKIADKAASFIGDANVDGEYIRQLVSCTNEDRSPIYKIHVTTNNPQFSITVANAVARAVVIELNTLSSSNKAQMLDEAYTYEQIFNGRKVQLRNIILFALAGFILGVLIILLMASSTTKIESVNDVTLNGEIEILGVVPNFDVE